jgi:hypothetical protein
MFLLSIYKLKTSRTAPPSPHATQEGSQLLHGLLQGTERNCAILPEAITLAPKIGALE